jgi:hypothetical protein
MTDGDPTAGGDAPLFEHKLPGSGVALYPNRIEKWASRWPLGEKRETILLRNVTTVTKGMQNKVTVTTNDGKKHDFVAGGQSNTLRDAILRLL